MKDHSKADLRPVRYTEKHQAKQMPRECPIKAKLVEELLRKKK